MTPSTPQSLTTATYNIMVPMRDGTKLATDVYRPALPDGSPAPGKWPTILGRTSYNKSDPVTWVNPVANFFVPRGYAVVLQDLRGRGLSEGTGQYYHTANVNEGRDGYDTVEWIAAQPWSDGKVGMVGSSHGGIVQNVAALERPPHLSALWVDVAPTSAFDWEARQGGAMGLHMFGALFLHGWDAQELRNDPAAGRRIEEGAENLRGWLKQMPFKPGQTPIAAVPHLEEVLFHYQNEGVFNDWWRMEAMCQKASWDRFADIPAMLSGGWYDPFVADYTEQFAALTAQMSGQGLAGRASKGSARHSASARHAVPEALEGPQRKSPVRHAVPDAVLSSSKETLEGPQRKSPVRLLIGPWNHMGMRGRGASNIGEVDFGSDAFWGDGVYNGLRLRWFDRWLKGVKNGVDDEPPVRMFVMGGGSGRSLSLSKGPSPRHPEPAILSLSKDEGPHGSSPRHPELAFLSLSKDEGPQGRPAPAASGASRASAADASATGAPIIHHGGHWRAEKEWPLSRAVAAAYYLRAGGALSPQKPGPSDPPASWPHDPEDPVPSIGANVTGMYEWMKVPEGMNAAYIPARARMRSVIPDGPMHQKERPELVGCKPPYRLLSERADILVFQTPPLEQDIEVTGAVEVKLWVSSSAKDTDFTAKLLDVYPPSEEWPEGFHLPLCDSILRARFREGFDHEALLVPGNPCEIAIVMPPVSNLFKRGHRIRLDIASSNFPRFDVNPNTGEPLGRHTHTVKALNTVYLDEKRSSRIVLPVVPA